MKSLTEDVWELPYLQGKIPPHRSYYMLQYWTWKLDRGKKSQWPALVAIFFLTYIYNLMYVSLKLRKCVKLAEVLQGFQILEHNFHVTFHSVEVRWCWSSSILDGIYFLLKNLPDNIAVVPWLHYYGSERYNEKK